MEALVQVIEDVSLQVLLPHYAIFSTPTRIHIDWEPIP